jgi:hypothetical protein
VIWFILWVIVAIYFAVALYSFLSAAIAFYRPRAASKGCNPISLPPCRNGTYKPLH